MDDSQKKQAQITLLRLLAASPKSRKELERKLADKGYDSSVIQASLDDLETKGLLSDKAYAKNLVSRFTMVRPSGHRKISFELQRHGISKKIRDEMLADVNPSEERNRAKEIGLARWMRFQNLNPERRKKRVYDFLLRRGFDFQIARDLIEEFENKNEG